jgi:hypothetical protein
VSADRGLQPERTALARRRTWLAHAGVTMLALRSFTHLPVAFGLALLTVVLGAALGRRDRPGMRPATVAVIATSLVAVMT